MRKLLTALLLCAPLTVLAVGIGNDNPPSGGGDVTNTNLNTNITNVQVKPVIDANARARAEAWAASQSNSRSSAKALSGDSVSASTGGNSSSQLIEGNTSVSINTPDKQRVYNVPNVNMGHVYPTSPCMGATSIGGSGVGFGIGFGTSWTDDECGIRETARSFNGLGLKDDAVSVLCTSKYAKAAKVCSQQPE